jgi:FKBP12-rapamycin complex-associated protein
MEVWQALLSVRALVLPMHADARTWIKFASLCRSSGRADQGRRALVSLLRYDPATVTLGDAGFGSGSGAPLVMFAYAKHEWATAVDTRGRSRALARLADLCGEVAPPGGAWPPPPDAPPAVAAGAAADGYRAPLAARVSLRMGTWTWSATPRDDLDDAAVAAVLGHLETATSRAPGWARAWHTWALFNVQAMDHYARFDVAAAQRHAAPAVRGFFASVAVGGGAGRSAAVAGGAGPGLSGGGGGGASGDGGHLRARASRGAHLQDVLRLLTLWFNHGAQPDVRDALAEGFGHVSVDTWLGVLPQVIARIHTRQATIRGLIHTLLVSVGRAHPQALMYPLLVACKSQSPFRRAAAAAVVDAVRSHAATLVDQAALVSQELIRIAILWHEMWHEALEEASRQYFGESNVDAMLATLLPLHEMMERAGPTTLKEVAFVQAYGRELAEAHEWCTRYRASRKEAELHQAWDLYYHVFKRINKQLPSLTSLDLQYVAPALVRATHLELAVPGTYIAGEPVVTIASFAPTLTVITSKQRPRRLTIHGSDGAEYAFLLKGHEDLRQDERVMQLFGLVNSLLAADGPCAQRGLSIARYAVIPLSPNSGLIGWVPNCDTLHALIREYRDARRTPLNVEHRLMLGMAPDYDSLTVIQKVEVFEHALDSTAGDDVARVMWLKSRNSEVWLERRTAYTRSTAVMSMVGYLLGLGDRHPSNLMIDRYSGKLLHIDFGDCFEASMHRDKFPERVPFRLTRMMTRAMEVCGIEGGFRYVCEATARVLRGNKDSVLAMLEAFVHDPLINWRLLTTTVTTTAGAAVGGAGTATSGDGGVAGRVSGGGGAGMGAGEGAGAVPPAPPPPPTPLDSTAPGDGRGPDGEYGSPRSPLDTGRTAAAGLAGSPPPPPPTAAPLDSATPVESDPAASAAAAAAAAAADAADATEALNERAVAVVKRMSDKLTGRDWVLVEGGAGGGGGATGLPPGLALGAAAAGVSGLPGAGLAAGPAGASASSSGTLDADSVVAQVERLIQQATSHENLCQSYIGWCSFW